MTADSKLWARLKYSCRRIIFPWSSIKTNYIFYQSTFVSSLVFLWSVAMFLYLSTLSPDYLRFGRNHVITAPSLSFQPKPPDNIYSTLIHFRHGGSGNWQNLLKKFKDFLKDYSFGKRAGGFIPCNWKTQIGPGERCGVSPIKWWSHDTDVPCTAPEKFGMFHGRPCVIIKLNKVWGWEPQPFYNITQVEHHPTMPTELKEVVRAKWTKHCKGTDEEDKCPQLRMVWLSCEGQTEADRENLGRIHYGPWQGFPGFYYPYLNQRHYVSPLVFIQFRTITPGVLIQINCKAWAQNIEHDPRNPRKGGVHFEILMD